MGRLYKREKLFNEMNPPTPGILDATKHVGGSLLAKTGEAFSGVAQTAGSFLEAKGRSMQIEPNQQQAEMTNLFDAQNYINPVGSFINDKVKRAWDRTDTGKYFNEKVGGAIENSGESIRNFYAKNAELYSKKVDPNYASMRDEKGNIDPAKLVNPINILHQIAGGVGSMLPFITAVAASGGSVVPGAAVGYVTEKGDAFQQYSEELAKKKGIDVDQLSNKDIKDLDFKSDIYGVISGALEAYTPYKILNRLETKATKSLLKRVLIEAPKSALVNALREGTTEGLQRFSQNLISLSSQYDPQKPLSQGVIDEALGGFYTGMAFGAAEGLAPGQMSEEKQGKVENLEKESISGMKKQYEAGAEVGKPMVEGGQLSEKIVKGRVDDIAAKIDRSVETGKGVEFRKAMEGQRFANYEEFSAAADNAIKNSLSFDQYEKFNPNQVFAEVEENEKKRDIFSKVVKELPETAADELATAVSKPLAAENIAKLTEEEKTLMGIALHSAKELPGANIEMIDNNIKAIEETGVKIPKIEKTEVVNKPEKVVNKVVNPEKTPVEKPVLSAEKPVTKKEVIEAVEKVVPTESKKKLTSEEKDIAEIKNAIPEDARPQGVEAINEEAERDWEENYSEEYGELSVKLQKKQQELKQAKKGQRETIQKEIGDIASKQGKMEDVFMNKWSKPKKKSKKIGKKAKYQRMTERESEEARQFEGKNVLYKGEITTFEKAKEQFGKFIKENELPVYMAESITTDLGSRAFGVTTNKMVAFVQNPKENTAPHEAVHAYIKLFIGKNRYNKLISYIKQNKLTASATTEQAEEWLADNFEYYITEREMKKPDSKIKSLFKWVRKQLLKLSGKEDKIAAFYEALYEGKRPGKIQQALTKKAETGIKFQEEKLELSEKQKSEITKPISIDTNVTAKGGLRAQEVFKSGWRKLFKEEAPNNLADLLIRPADKYIVEAGYKSSFESGKRISRFKNKAEIQEARQEMREKNAIKVKQIRKDLKAMFKDKNEKAKNIKTKVIEYVKANLPEKDHKNFFTAIRDAKTLPNLAKIIDRVNGRREQYERSILVKQINKVTENIEKLPVDIQRTILSITSQIELKKHTKALLQRLNRTQEYLDSQSSDFGMPRRVLNELGILKRTPFNELSTQKLIEINNRLQQYSTIGRNLVISERALAAKTFNETVADLEKGSKNLDVVDPDKRRNIFEADKIKNVEKVKDRLRRLDLSLIGIDRFFNRLDGRVDYTGANYRIFKEPVDKNWNAWKYEENKISTAFYEMLNNSKMTEENSRRIAIHAYREQRGGTKKLLEDRKITQEQIDSVKLTDKEMDVYRFMRNKLDELHEALSKKMEKENNVILGKPVNYFPMMTDYAVSKPLVEEFESENRLKSVPFGSVKERKKNANQTLQLDAFQVFGSYVGKSTYFIAMDSTVQKLSKLAGSEKYRKAVGENAQSVVLTWLDVLARKGGSLKDEAPWLKKINDWNNNLSVAILGLRLTTVLKQPLALLDGAAEIGGYAFEGTRLIMQDEWMSFMNENSSEIRERFADPFLEEISHDKKLKKVKHIAMYPIQLMDNLTARSVWAGAYTKKMDEMGLKVDLENPDKKALKYADLVVRKTQASAAFKDLPTIMTGKNRQGAKLIMKFQTFILNRWSYLREDLPDNMKNNKKRAIQQIAFLSLSMMLEAGISSLYFTMLYGDGGDGEDDESKISIITRSIASSLIQTVPFLGQLFSSLNYGANPVPLISTADKLRISLGQATSMKDSTKAKTRVKHAIRAMSYGLGTYYGIPTDQARQLLEKWLFPTGPAKGSF